MALPTPSEQSTAVVTGASSGIGAELARALARRGHGVTLVARREERLRDLAEELTAAHAIRAEVIAADLGEAGSRTKMLAQFAELGLAADVLINNAGFGSAGRFQRLDAEREAEMVRLNCEAVVALCGRFVPEMIERGRGAILNVASVAAFQPIPRQVTYAATKAFVLSFTEGLTADLHGTGVTATALCPGPVRTEFIEVAEIGRGFDKIGPGAMWVSPEDVAEAGIKGLEGGKRVVVPGAINRAASLGGQHAPRSALLGLARRFYPVGGSKR